MPSRSPRFVASGNINPARFVQFDASNDFTVLEVDTAGTDRIVGVSQEGKRRPPGVDGETQYAAAAGETLHVYGPGEECLIEAGAAIVRGDWLKSLADGRATPVLWNETANTAVGGIALESASGAGVLIRMLVNLTVVRPA